VAATLTVREALWRVGVLLQDVDPQYTRHPERELVNWLGDAELAICKFLPSACSRVDAIKLKPGTRQSIESVAAADCKPGDGTTPAAAILGTQLLGLPRNMGTDGLTPGKTIRVVQREILDSQSPSWHQVSGTEVRQFTYDPNTPLYFYVSPGVPAVGSVWVEAAWNAQPTRYANTGAPGSELYRYDGASATKLNLRDEFIDDVVNYVVARAYMKNAQFAGNDQKASTFASLFTGSLNAKVAALTGHSPNLKFLPFAPEPLGAAS
jgi:hypothetical protein